MRGEDHVYEGEAEQTGTSADDDGYGQAGPERVDADGCDRVREQGKLARAHEERGGRTGDPSDRSVCAGGAWRARRDSNP